MKLEADGWPRLDVLHAGQQQRGQQLAIAQSLVNPIGNFFQQPVARRFFDEPHQRLDLRLQPHDVRRELRFGRRHGAKPREKPKVAKPQDGAGCCASLQYVSARDFSEHDFILRIECDK